MATKTDVFNGVCLALGVTPDIQNPDTDNGDTAVCIRGAWDAARKATLRDHAWNFAEVTEKLTVIGTPPQGWRCQYLYPTDCLNALAIAQPDRNGRPIPFKVSTYKDDDNGRVKVILTDVEEAELIYTADIQDESMFDPLYTNAFIFWLAYLVSGVRSTKKEVVERIYNSYERAKFAAGASNSNEQVQDDQRDADWIAGRN